MRRLILFLFLFGVNLNSSFAQYEPNWDSIDSRPIPDWFDKAKIGVFLHWGVYSVPSFGTEWFWHSWEVDHDQGTIDFVEQNYGPGFTYQDFARDFTAEFFNPWYWADLFASAGAKYVVLTSKHHEGYTLWPSKYSYSWNSMDVGPKRDLVGDLATAVRSRDLRFGVYHSLLEWFHPLYIEDKANNWETSNFVDTKAMPELYELVNTYQPEIIWSDGEWEAPSTYWKGPEFLAWLYNDSPVKDTVVANDRWGSDTMCAHGGYFSCNDRFVPGELMDRKWESAMTLDLASWGYRRLAFANDIMPIETLLGTLAQVVAFGGNLLINVGPTKEGTIVPIFQERFTQLGTWMNISGEAIYETSPWEFQNDTITPNVWYTSNAPNVYAIVLDWPQGNVLSLGNAASLFGTDATLITLLGNDGYLPYTVHDGQVDVTFPDKATVVCPWAWVVKIAPANL